MSRCRIYLFTYKRNELLKRCISSLVQQTYTNWTCELHNDDPADSFPQEYLERLKDKRFILKNHKQNLGALESFNMTYGQCSEDYVSMLEDDNWWEPAFLERMLHQMDSNPNVQMSWCNMNLWKEEVNGEWTSLNRTINPETTDTTTSFEFPNFKHACGSFHSNGAMVVRNSDLASLKTPTNMRFDFVEHVRERAFKFPILRINSPLANFAITRESSRKNDLIGINEHYYLLLCSFFRYVVPTNELLENIWKDARASSVKSTNKLIYAGLFDRNCRPLLQKASLYDLVYFFLYNIKRPYVLLNCIKAKKRYSELWLYLLESTRASSKA